MPSSLTMTSGAGAQQASRKAEARASAQGLLTRAPKLEWITNRRSPRGSVNSSAMTVRSDEMAPRTSTWW